MTSRPFVLTLALLSGFTAPRLTHAERSAPQAIAPDPEPMRERDQWVLGLKYAKGDIFLLSTRKVTLDAPRATPRAMGRFAVELFEGLALIERVRFDFPLFGAESESALANDRAKSQALGFETKITTRVGVMFPATRRGTRLELWDRATNRRWPLAWPPTI